MVVVAVCKESLIVNGSFMLRADQISRVILFFLTADMNTHRKYGFHRYASRVVSTCFSRIYCISLDVHSRWPNSNTNINRSMGGGWYWQTWRVCLSLVALNLLQAIVDSYRLRPWFVWRVPTKSRQVMLELKRLCKCCVSARICVSVPVRQ